jgi:hypothetical protein
MSGTHIPSSRTGDVTNEDRHFEIALDRPLTLDDLDLGSSPEADIVKSFCDAFAERLVQRYLSNGISWHDADAVANHYFSLMIQHCGKRMPDYAWEVYLAFDEGEIDGRGDSFTRQRLTEVQSKYGRG